MNVIGLDIGTTSICAAAIDADSGDILKIISFANSFAVAAREYERCQNAAAIADICIKAVDELIDGYSPVCSIGVTGQMHGVVYLDSKLNPVSSLYTWQDMSGNQKNGDMTYAQLLSQITAYPAASGFGLTTVFAHVQKNETPASAAKICTVHDYIAAKLCSLTSPVMHTSDAASFGVFDISTLDFDRNAAEKAGMPSSLLPEITGNCEIIGSHRGIPVCVAIGDNQASFIGSVADMGNSLLINIGTGSQMSLLAGSDDYVPSTELRPVDGHRLLRVGSALCGGRAFAALEEFIRATANLAGADINSAYSCIDTYLAQNSQPGEPLSVSTKFSGTRDNPDETGCIGAITLNNFTPGHLIYGVLGGITDELYNMYISCPGAACTRLIGSGNGLRKNPALQRIISSRFGLELEIPVHREEACYGAAVYSLAACGYSASLSEAQKLIKYIRA